MFYLYYNFRIKIKIEYFEVIRSILYTIANLSSHFHLTVNKQQHLFFSNKLNYDIRGREYKYGSMI